MVYIGKFKGIFNPDYHGSGIFLKRAINKHGEDKFYTQLIGYAETKKQLNEMEKEYIQFYRNIYGRKRLYNISDGGDGGHLNKGYRPSKETREKMSLASRGNTHFLGKHHTQEAKDKVSLANKGKAYRLGKYHTDETKEKMRRAMLGKKRKPFTEEHIQNMIKNHVGMLGKVAWNKGKKNCYTESVIKAMSKAKKGKHMSPETEFKKGHISYRKCLNKGGIKI